MDWQIEKTLFKINDGFGDLLVKEYGLLRNLYFGDYKKQSSLFLPEPSVIVLNYAQAMMTALFFCQQPRKVLMVGLGGGTLLHFIHKFFPDCQIDVVEIRSTVIDVAKRFFKVSDVDQMINVYHCDAKNLVAQKINHREKYDLVLVDAFDQWGPAEIYSSRDFVSNCRELTHDQGLCSFNLWNRKEDDFPGTLKQFNKLFSNNVLQLSLGNKNSNVILHTFPKDLYRNRLIKLDGLAETYRQKFGIDFPMYYKMLLKQNQSMLSLFKKAVFS